MYSNVEGKVSARYVRSYIEAGEAAAGRPIGAAERAIIDTFEAVTKRPELMLEFTLQPGEAYFINNYTILRSRLDFLTHLGRGLSQSVLGDRLGHVKDFSREDPGARAYRNKQELSPHTDSCDLVGLLCLRNARRAAVCHD